jgi:hypothetical protein
MIGHAGSTFIARPMCIRIEISQAI